jgi:hypothetical protein
MAGLLSGPKNGAIKPFPEISHEFPTLLNLVGFLLLYWWHSTLHRKISPSKMLKSRVGVYFVVCVQA